MKNNLIYALLAINLFAGCYWEPAKDWHIVYQADKDGKKLFGDKTKLISAIRAGKDIKIGWGHKGKTHTIEHVAEPIWLAILDEQEVVARLEPQVGGKVDWVRLEATYNDSISLDTEWRVIITTKGSFDAVWINRKTFEVKRRVPQHHPMTWYVSTDEISQNSLPLF